MELKEFVNQALVQIIQGVIEAQKFAHENGALVAPGMDTKISDIYFGLHEHKVEFDVAISTSDSIEGKVGAGLFVAGVTLGGQGTAEQANQTISHIKFSVPLYYPSQKTRRL